MKKWSKSEENFLREKYSELSTAEIAKALNRTIPSIMKKARELKLRKRPENWFWKEEERKFLKENWNKLSVEQLANKLGRTPRAIKSQAAYLGLERKKRRWNQEEINFLKENYGKIPLDEIARKLNRSIFTIKSKAIDLGLTKKKVFWTEEEVEFLKKNYGILTNEELSEILGKTKIAINRKAHKLGLKKEINVKIRKIEKCTLTNEDWAYIAGLFDGEGYISVDRQNTIPAPKIGITNTDQGVIKWLASKLSYGTISKYKNRGNCKTKFTFYINKLEAQKDFLQNILPFLKIKQERAKLALEMIKIKERIFNRKKVKIPEELSELAKQIVLLNKRGAE